MKYNTNFHKILKNDELSPNHLTSLVLQYINSKEDQSKGMNSKTIHQNLKQFAQNFIPIERKGRVVSQNYF